MTFDAEEARRIFSRRWAEGLFEMYFTPFESMVKSMETEFHNVRVAKKRRNKVSVFRFTDAENREQYRRTIWSNFDCARLLNQCLNNVIDLVSDAHTGHFEEVKRMFMMVLVRWHAVLPCKLVGRDEKGIIAYANAYCDSVERCLVSMYERESVVYDLATRRIAKRGGNIARADA